MNAVIEITHYGANVTYVREATVSPWLAGPISRQPSAGGMLRGSWVSLAVAAAPIELARSDGQSGGYSEPEVGFEEIAINLLKGRFCGIWRATFQDTTLGSMCFDEGDDVYWEGNSDLSGSGSSLRGVSTGIFRYISR
jgi:hypothetical protein